MHPLVIAITGASGAVYAKRLLEVLLCAGRDVHLVISPSGKVVLKQELHVDVNLEQFQLSSLGLDLSIRPTDPRLAAVRSLQQSPPLGRVTYHHHADFMTPIASGSYLTDGMVICPCSGSTVAGVVHGTGDNLIHRAADVHLKERRKLVLVPRETPLSVVQLQNMARAAEVGAVVLPASPGWYHGVTSLQDLIDFIVARIVDQFGVRHQLMQRWQAEPQAGEGVTHV
ncbi:MAG TPA: flavin prenyltransferase UbiX [Pirellulaceae bacterium]|nr:flavin prenyltransferase UbiX [Pirellulaceae bacterium]